MGTHPLPLRRPHPPSLEPTNFEQMPICFARITHLVEVPVSNFLVQPPVCGERVIKTIVLTCSVRQIESDQLCAVNLVRVKFASDVLHVIEMLNLALYDFSVHIPVCVVASTAFFTSSVLDFDVSVGPQIFWSLLLPPVIATASKAPPRTEI